MLRQIDGRELKLDRLGSLEPQRVLFEFDGPRTWLANDPDGELLLLHQCGEAKDVWQYLVVPFSERLATELERGEIDLRDALDQPRLWIAEFTGSTLGKLVQTSFSKVNDWIPDSGVMLYPELEPLLSVRALGKNVELGRASLGILKTSLENTRSCLKVLADCAAGVSAVPGQPKARMRKYYDLPARLLAGSVKVCVFPPDESQRPLFEDEIWQRMEEVFDRGLAQLSDLSAAPEPDADPELNAALQAVHRLTPPSYGAVEEIEVSGRLVATFESVSITRQTGTALRQRFQKATPKKPKIVEDSGIITELDRDESTCKLRDEQGVTLHELSFDETLFDDVKAAFDEGCPVKIAGKTNQASTVELLAVEFLS